MKTSRLATPIRSLRSKLRPRLVLAHVVGKRGTAAAREVLTRLDWVAPERFQLTTDGYPEYTKGVRRCIGNRIDYAQLVKMYGKSNFRSAAPDTRYSPAPIIGVRVHPIFGKPDRDRINTSYIERFNLDVRMKCRRMTRLTNAFSKSWNHHVAAIALLMAWHNFCRIHGSTKATPAVAAGIAEKPWSIRELLERAAERV
jgi:IS1 family transposase